MVSGIDLFFALFNNLAIFIALVAIYGYLLVQFKQATWYKRQFVLGLSFGIFAVGCMYAKIPVFKGVIVDQRNAIIVLSGAFGGPLSAIISAFLAGSFRIYLGGDGVIGGVIGVHLAAISGIGLNVFSERFKSIGKIALGSLLATVIIMPGFLFLEDLQTGWKLMKAMTIPYGSAIFLGIFLGTLLLKREESRYQIELLFRESEERYREIVEGTNELITQVDKHGKFTFVNHISEQILGLPPEECIGESAFQFVYPEDREKTKEWFEQCLAQKAKQAWIENRQVNAKTGKIHTVLWSSAFEFDDSGNFVGVDSFARDITKRAQAEESLRKSEAQYRTLFEYVPDGILIADSESYYLDANPIMCKMLGYTHEELIGLHASDIVIPEKDKNIKPVLNLLKAKSDYFQAWKFKRKDGFVFSAEVLVTTMPDNTFLAMVRDVTKRKELEAQLIQSQKMDSIGRLAGGIAHDFNNLLVPIMGYVDLGLMNLAPEDKLHVNLTRVREAAKRAAGLTRQILAFSRRQVLEMRVLNLNEIVSSFEAMMQRLIGEDIELRTFLKPGIYLVNADSGQIEQVLMNLIVNAREAMPSGGKLTIETANVYLDEGYVKKYGNAQPTGQYAMFTVSDTGQGMDEETQKRIFEPFFTTKSQGKGTGLGLATVFGIVRQHKGNIWVYSEPGKGTTFKIYLPQAEGVAQTVGATSSKSDSIYGTETILVVEDDEMVRKLVCETLTAHGYEVLEAQDPNDALRIASGYEASLHLLLTDVIMPDMNGRELYNKAISFHPDLKVLYMSGYTDNVIVHHGILDEGIDFVQKPFTIQSLTQKVKFVLS